MWRHQSCQQETTHWCLHRIYRCNCKVWGQVRGKKDIFSSGLMNIELMSSSSSMWQQESQWKTAPFTPPPPYFFYIRHVRVCPWSVSNLGAYMSPTPPSPPPSVSCSYTFRRNCQTLVNAQNATDLKSMPTTTMSAHASDGASRRKSWCYIAAGKIYTYISIADAWWLQWDDSTRRL